MSQPSVRIVPTLTDNYSYVVKSGASQLCIDVGDSAPIVKSLKVHGINLSGILVTHNHYDHTDGVAALCEACTCPVYAAFFVDGVPSELMHIVKDGDDIEGLRVIESPGHEAHHVMFYDPIQRYIFVGDVLFGMGCGRAQPGKLRDMWDSLQKIKALPDNVLVYSGHEYTLNTHKFWQCFNDDPFMHKSMAAYYEAQQHALDTHATTMPLSLGAEKQYNPFLRAPSFEIFKKWREIKDKR
jgi:hydroxyacylglutathione hydrolase